MKSSSVREYNFGKTDFNADERRRYAIEDIQCAKFDGPGSFIVYDYAKMRFPGETGVNGYLIGLKLYDCQGNGINGQWCLPSRKEVHGY